MPLQISWRSKTKLGNAMMSQAKARSGDLCVTQAISFLQPARLLRTVHTQITATKALFEGMPSRDGARFGARTTMATVTDRTTAVGAHDRLTTSEQGRLA
jgi:hypothetical protein